MKRHKISISKEQIDIQETPRQSLWSSMKANAFQLCMQAVQVCVGVTILLFGLVVGGVGLWAMLGQQELITISNGDPRLTKLPLSLIVVGIIVALLGLVGVIGGLFVRTMTGRILIGVYAFVLVLLIINEIGAGVSAVMFRENLRQVFINSSLQSLMRYGHPNFTTVTDDWDKFQNTHKCCGAVNFTSYRKVFNNHTVPASCCHPGLDEMDCTQARLNATAAETNKLYIGGCPDTVIGELENNDLNVAIIVIVFAAAQFTGVLLACSMIYAGSKVERKTSIKYKLVHEQT